MAAALGIAVSIACFGGLYLMETERILLFLVAPVIAVSVRARDYDARFALVVVPKDASHAVIVVPTFSPKTNAAAVSNSITLMEASPMVIASVAEED